MMPALGTSVASGAGSQPVIAQYFGIFHCTRSAEEFKAIVNAAPFGACNLLLLAFVHTVKSPDPDGGYIAQFNDGREPPCPPGKPPDSDKERVALVINRARALNPTIKILLSLGYDPGDLGNAAATPSQFADSVARLVQDNVLDGFDIDYETPDGVTAEQLVVLVDA